MDLKKEGDRRGGGVEKLRSGERVIRSDIEGREVVNHYLNLPFRFKNFEPKT